ncbi:hypothetical protein OFN64_29210, partial [Escherichia coli]|nr:hypothetical protein [Escherichia coli]
MRLCAPGVGIISTIPGDRYGVMDGTSDAGAMLATVILVWKALGPIMGIYNSISKFQSIKASSAQINNLMAMNDDKLTLEKSPP